MVGGFHCHISFQAGFFELWKKGLAAVELLGPSFTRRCHAGAFAKALRTNPWRSGGTWSIQKTLTFPFKNNNSPPRFPPFFKKGSSTTERIRDGISTSLIPKPLSLNHIQRKPPRTPDGISCCADACWAKHPNSPHDHGNVNIGSQQEKEPWSAQANGTTRDLMTSPSSFFSKLLVSLLSASRSK